MILKSKPNAQNNHKKELLNSVNKVKQSTIN